MKSLQNKVAIITGGGRGIGREIALAFSREGAHVVVGSRTSKELDLTLSQIKSEGGVGIGIPTTEVMGLTSTFFWNLEVEDNAFAILRTSSGQTASLHSSWTQWKNSFLFEIFGREGYLKIEGLGKSYGAERLILGKRRPESGPPNESVFNFPEVDISWEEEWGDFRNSIQTGNMPLSSAEESVKVMKIIDSIYRSAILKKMVKVSE